MRQRRFVRGRNAGDTKIRNRRESPGMFLGRLWALFGRPTVLTDDGYSYSVHDRDTDSMFEAYSGASGPAYRAAPSDAKKLDSVLAAFDALLDKTAAAECRLEIPVGDGKTFVVGVQRGKPFEELVSPPPPTNAEAVATAKRVLATENSDAMVYYIAML